MNNINEEKVRQDVSHLVASTRGEDAIRLSNARNKALEQAQIKRSPPWFLGAAASVALVVAVMVTKVEPTQTTDSIITSQVADVNLVTDDYDDEYYDDFYYWLDIYDQELIAVSN